MAESAKVTTFLAALRALCQEHQVILATSGSDTLQVWDVREGEDVLECRGIEDCTGLRLAPGDAEES